MPETDWEKSERIRREEETLEKLEKHERLLEELKRQGDREREVEELKIKTIQLRYKSESLICFNKAIQLNPSFINIMVKNWLDEKETGLINAVRGISSINIVVKNWLDEEASGSIDAERQIPIDKPIDEFIDKMEETRKYGGAKKKCHTTRWFAASLNSDAKTFKTTIEILDILYKKDFLEKDIKERCMILSERLKKVSEKIIPLVDLVDRLKRKTENELENEERKAKIVAKIFLFLTIFLAFFSILMSCIKMGQVFEVPFFDKYIMLLLWGSTVISYIIVIALRTKK